MSVTHVPSVVLSFNSTPHSSTGYTGYSPYFLAHGREPRPPAHVQVSSPREPYSPQNYGSELVSRLDSAFEAVRLHREEQKLKREHYYNRRVQFKPYVCGDFVWLDDPPITKTNTLPKLDWTF